MIGRMFDKISDSVLRQPGFNKWSYYHKARKYARMMKGKYRRYINNKGKAPMELRRLRSHYTDLCWTLPAMSVYPNDVAHDLKAHRANEKYLKWYRKNNKFKVGMIIRCPKDSFRYDDLGDGLYRITSVNKYIVDDGGPNMVVTLYNMTTNTPVTFVIGDSTPELSLYSTIHLMPQRPYGMYWHNTAEELRRNCAEYAKDYGDDPYGTMYFDTPY